MGGTTPGMGCEGQLNCSLAVPLSCEGASGALAASSSNAATTIAHSGPLG